MDETRTSITAEEWLDRMSQLALRHGVHLSTLQQKDGRDLALFFAGAAPAFPLDVSLSEHDANQILKRFLATAGARVSTDHVELRRWMVDTGFLQRSDFGTDYRRGVIPEWLVDAAQALDFERIATVVGQARSANEAQRETRRRAWLASQIEVTEGGDIAAGKRAPTRRSCGSHSIRRTTPGRCPKFRWVR